MDSHFDVGEGLHVPERVIIAPEVGRFRPRDGIVEGMRIDRGESIGEVHGPGTAIPVCSPFDGVFQGVLTVPGERLRRGQPVAWLRVA